MRQGNHGGPSTGTASQLLLGVPGIHDQETAAQPVTHNPLPSPVFYLRAVAPWRLTSLSTALLPSVSIAGDLSSLLKLS